MFNPKNYFRRTNVNNGLSLYDFPFYKMLTRQIFRILVLDPIKAEEK